MDHSEQRIRDLQTEMRYERELHRREIRELRERIWQLELMPLRVMEYASWALPLVVIGAILAGY